MNLHIGEHGDFLVEQADQLADHAALGLPALAEEDHVLAGQQRVDEGRLDGVLVAHDAGEERLVAGQPGQQVVADFGPHRFGLVAALAQLSDGLRSLGSFGHAVPSSSHPPPWAWLFG